MVDIKKNLKQKSYKRGRGLVLKKSYLSKESDKAGEQCGALEATRCRRCEEQA